MRRRFIQKTSSYNYMDYMTIEALEDMSVLFPTVVQLSINGSSWKYLRGCSIKAGEMCSVKNTMEKGNATGFGKIFFSGGRFNLRGNCLSLIFGDYANSHKDLTGYHWVFMETFAGSNVCSVDKNFLPAITLSNYCYNSMFGGCKLLTNAPELPAPTLCDYCYGDMYNGCTNLNHINMLATDISANECLKYWVKGVASNGTFVKNPAMTTLPTATESNYYAGIPSGWTVVNA